ncbi:MAG: nucleoside deaminase [Rickettsiaceae bacterium]|nr:nucleoside deaminase [Rickettsiaceae bacterium]
MQEALKQAELAFAAGEVPVGCVIVLRDNNEIIAKSYNMMQQNKNSNAHAEIIALTDASSKLQSKNLSACDIYVTLEPCTMCTSAIANSRVARLYYAADDTKHGAVSNGVRFFTTKSCFHRPEIYSGIASKESSLLLQNFFGKLRKNKLQ